MSQHATCVPNEDPNQAAGADPALSARRNFASLAIEKVPSEDSDQTAHSHEFIVLTAQLPILTEVAKTS